MRFSFLTTLAAATVALVSAAHADRLTDQPLIDAAWLKSNLGNENLVVIDVRDPTKEANPYALGHVPGSVSAPYGSYGWRTEVKGVPAQLPPIPQIAGIIGKLGVDNDKQVVIIPAGKDSSDFGSATRVYWTFKVLGHDAVTILNGGWQAWEAAQGEVSTVASAPEVATFKATFRPELYATTADVEKARTNGTKLVDGRPAAQFEGKAKSPVVRAAGTIPGAINIEQGKFYDAKKASFVSKDVVADLAKNAGLKENEKNIAFCNTGHWASVAWFGLSEIEGNKNTKLYDGSMAEWAADPARPVQ
ncbi:MAG: sulfurtransferase [Phyllobacterium sp.]